MQKTLMVNGVDCGTVVIDKMWYVIVDDVPQMLYRGWRKCKGYKNKERWVVKLKYTCVVCGKENFGQLHKPRKYCSKRCFGKINEKILNSKHMKMSEDNGLKKRAVGFINNRIEGGKIKRPEICGNCGCCGNIQAHHPDYDKPNEVIWLCISCHKKLHFGNKNVQGKLIVYAVAM